jgi:hypothetical protein
MSSTSGNQPPDHNWLGREFADAAQAESLPTMLNVLTILTIIFSAFGFLGALGSFALAPFGYQSAVNAREMTDQMPPFFRSLIGNGQEAARLAYINRVPIMVIAAIGAILCLFGALQMRKRRKIGFYLYVLGDLLPIANLIFFTTFSFISGFAYGISFAFALAFVILYATQLKHMK